MGKILDVKGVQGFKTFMKKIAVTASTGTNVNELIGQCTIPLQVKSEHLKLYLWAYLELKISIFCLRHTQTIPANGSVRWFSIDKTDKRRGLISIRITFSAQKDNTVAFQEHRHLLQILLMHELDMTKVLPYCWPGEFSPQGESVIQYATQSIVSLTPRAYALAQWTVFTATHVHHPLTFRVFDKLLDKLTSRVKTLLFDDDLKMFWDGVRKLLPSCFLVIRNSRKDTGIDESTTEIMSEILSVLSKLMLLQPIDIDLFPKELYRYIVDIDKKIYILKLY